VAVIGTLALYYPLLIGAQRVAYYVALLWNQVQKVQPFQFTAFIALSFAALALLVSGHWVYLLYHDLYCGE
jgi:hypothetical protein